MLDILFAAGVIYGLYRLTAPKASATQNPASEPGSTEGTEASEGVEGGVAPVRPPYEGQNCPYFDLRCAPKGQDARCPALDGPCPYSAKYGASEEVSGEDEEDDSSAPTEEGTTPTPLAPPRLDPSPFSPSLAETVAPLKKDGWNGSFDDVLPDDAPLTDADLGGDDEAEEDEDGVSEDEDGVSEDEESEG